MWKKNRGFTLIEAVVTLALVSLLSLGLTSVVSSLYSLINKTNTLSQAQITANTAMTLIQNRIRNANYVNIESSLPSTPNQAYRYLFGSEGGIHEIQEGAQRKILYGVQGEYAYQTSFSRVNDKTLRISLDVTRGGDVVYRTQSDVVPNNLVAKNITGAAQGTCLSYQVIVQTFKPVTSISVTSNSSFITVQSQTMQFGATVSPSDATAKSVAWSVSDSTIANIDQTGLLRPLRNGIVNIIATALDGSGVTGTKQIIISNQKVTIQNLELISSSGMNQLKVGRNTLRIIPVFTPFDATNKTITWSIDDNKYATIDSNGVLTSDDKQSGHSVIVTAKTNDGSNLTATIEILIVG